MAHYLFNFTEGDRRQAVERLRAKRWEVGLHEHYRDALAPGDLVLIYLAAPESEFIGHAELATAADDGEVLLAHVDEWEHAVPMHAVVKRIDPTATNPLVQRNAAVGFPLGIVRITADEYEAACALSRGR